MHNKRSKQIYEKPNLKVVSFMVEHGFAGTGGEGNSQIIDPTAENPAVVSENLNQRDAFSSNSISYDGF